MKAGRLRKKGSSAISRYIAEATSIVLCCGHSRASNLCWMCVYRSCSRSCRTVRKRSKPWKKSSSTKLGKI